MKSILIVLLLVAAGAYADHDSSQSDAPEIDAPAPFPKPDRRPLYIWGCWIEGECELQHFSQHHRYCSAGDPKAQATADHPDDVLCRYSKLVSRDTTCTITKERCDTAGKVQPQPRNYPPPYTY